MIEISRTQDEEVGDGTTSVIILGAYPSTSRAPSHLPSLSAGEVLSVATPFLEQKMHPTIIIQAFRMALDDIITLCRDKLRFRLFHEGHSRRVACGLACQST